jgi:hypothetical protein
MNRTKSRIQTVGSNCPLDLCTLNRIKPHSLERLQSSAIWKAECNLLPGVRLHISLSCLVCRAMQLSLMANKSKTNLNELTAQ